MNNDQAALDREAIQRVAELALSVWADEDDKPTRMANAEAFRRVLTLAKRPYALSGEERATLEMALAQTKHFLDLHSKVPPTTQAGFETLLYMENRHCALTTALNMAGFTRDELLELSRLAYLGSDVAITPELSGDVLEKLDAMLAEEGE